jgi:hypothetical protein
MVVSALLSMVQISELLLVLDAGGLYTVRLFCHWIRDMNWRHYLEQSVAAAIMA